MAVSTYSLGRLDQDVQHTVWVFFDPICADRVVGINTVGRGEWGACVQFEPALHCGCSAAGIPGYLVSIMNGEEEGISA